MESVSTQTRLDAQSPESICSRQLQCKRSLLRMNFPYPHKHLFSGNVFFLTKMKRLTLKHCVIVEMYLLYSDVRAVSATCSLLFTVLVCAPRIQSGSPEGSCYVWIRRKASSRSDRPFVRINGGEKRRLSRAKLHLLLVQPMKKLNQYNMQNHA